MNVFLINLDRNIDRLREADKQLKRVGVDYERIVAIDGRMLNEGEKLAAVNHFRLWCSQGRSLRSGEIGCAMSHYSIFQTMIERKILYACVLEDDVCLDVKFKETLSKIETWLDANKAQVVLLCNHSQEKGEGIVASKGDMYAEGYVLTTVAAQALLCANWPLQAPCDHWRRWVIRGDIELYHALPPVCQQNKSRYVSDTNTGGFVVSEFPLAKWMLHKIKRVIGKSIDAILLRYDRLVKGIRQ